MSVLPRPRILLALALALRLALRLFVGMRERIPTGTRRALLLLRRADQILPGLAVG